MTESVIAGRAIDIPNETGFWIGRGFRTFREFSQPSGTHIPTNQRILIRATIAVNTLLLSLEIALDAGTARITTFAGGTPTGAFVNSLPVIPANGMSGTPSYSALNTMTATAAGTSAAVNLSGGVQLDVIRLKVQNATGNASSVGSFEGSVRGLEPGTYYILVDNISSGDLEGTLKARWTEAPPENAW